jgi:hypothetical protein
MIVASSTGLMILTCVIAAVGPALRVRKSGAFDALRE